MNSLQNFFPSHENLACPPSQNSPKNENSACCLFGITAAPVRYYELINFIKYGKKAYQVT